MERFWEGTGLLHQMRGEWFDAVSCCVTFTRGSIATRRPWGSLLGSGYTKLLGFPWLESHLFGTISGRRRKPWWIPENPKGFPWFSCRFLHLSLVWAVRIRRCHCVTAGTKTPWSSDTPSCALSWAHALSTSCWPSLMLLMLTVVRSDESLSWKCFRRDWRRDRSDVRIQKYCRGDAICSADLFLAAFRWRLWFLRDHWCLTCKEPVEFIWLRFVDLEDFQLACCKAVIVYINRCQSNSASADGHVFNIYSQTLSTTHTHKVRIYNMPDPTKYKKATLAHCKLEQQQLTTYSCTTLTKAVHAMSINVEHLTHEEYVHASAESREL